MNFHHGSKIREKSYNEAPAWALVGVLDVDASSKLMDKSEKSFTIVLYGELVQCGFFMARSFQHRLSEGRRSTDQVQSQGAPQY